MSILQKSIILKDKFLNRPASEMMRFQRIYGRFYVLYNNGKRSHNMSYTTAKDYAEMFGGTVYHASQEVSKTQ